MNAHTLCLFAVVPDGVFPRRRFTRPRSRLHQGNAPKPRESLLIGQQQHVTQTPPANVEFQNLVTEDGSPQSELSSVSSDLQNVWPPAVTDVQGWLLCAFLKLETQI